MTRIYQGEATPIYITITDEHGDLLDLTGAQVRYIVYPGSGDVVIDKAAVVVSPGYVRVDLGEADTGFKAGRYTEEVRVWLASGMIRTIIDDGFTLVRSGFHGL